MVCSRCGAPDSTELEEAQSQVQEARAEAEAEAARADVACAEAQAALKEAEVARTELAHLQTAGFQLQEAYCKSLADLSQAVGSTAYWRALCEARQETVSTRAVIQTPRGRARVRGTSWKPSQDEADAAKKKQLVERRRMRSQSGLVPEPKFVLSPRGVIDEGSPPVKRALHVEGRLLSFPSPCRKRSTERLLVALASIPTPSRKRDTKPAAIVGGEDTSRVAAASPLDTTPTGKRSESLGDCVDYVSSPQYFSIASPFRQARRARTARPPRTRVRSPAVPFDRVHWRP